MNSTLSFLLLALLAISTQAFAPVSQPRFTTSLGIDNAYLRGGKPSWAFEAETMYVEGEEPAKKGKKAAPAKPVKKEATVPSKMTIAKFFNLKK